MLKFIDTWKKKKDLKARLLGFLQEMKDNLETYYVMTQLGRLRPFLLESWKSVQGLKEFSISDKVRGYGCALEEYNVCFTDFKDYEEWYSADLSRKTPEYARILHAKKEKAVSKSQKLDHAIKPAIEDFEQYLYQMNILKRK